MHVLNQLRLRYYYCGSIAILFLIADKSNAVPNYECHSCLKSCETTADGRLNPEICDCSADLAGTSKEPSTCAGSYCFAKIEYFPDEATVIIQKGCIDGLVKGLTGCHYAGQPESVHCYCEGHLCNNKDELHSYLPKPLPTLECCECSQPNGDICPKDECLRTCRGNYCLIDFDGVEQGCGLGMPRLQSFLRIPNYLQNLQGETTCAKYQATFSTSVHGCVCTKPTGMCNGLEDMTQYQVENVVKRRIDDQNYCYSLHQRDYEHPFDEGVFNKSETCEGHYCFIVLTTSELVVEVRNSPQNTSIASSNSPSTRRFYSGKSEPRFEILAGCLKVDDDKKVSLGCTTEYIGEGKVLSKHCICDSHLCNYYNLIASAHPPTDANGRRAQSQTLDEESHSATGILRDDADLPPPSSSTIPLYPMATTNLFLHFLLIVTLVMRLP